MTTAEKYRSEHYNARQRFERAQSFSNVRYSHLASFAMAGVAIVVAVATAGHYLGQNAVARSLPEHAWHDITMVTANQKASVSSDLSPLQPAKFQRYSTSSTISQKGSFLRSRVILASVANPVAFKGSKLSESDKADLLIDDQIVIAKPANRVKLQKAVVSPPVWKIERSWKLGQKRKSKAIGRRNTRLAEQSCLSRAIYFEARSETELGQLAVAKVILNRKKSKEFPNTICGVVYQGAKRHNSCQFSFACDGASDQPRNGKAWRQARHIAREALHGNTSRVKIISTATHYHADYVTPSWAHAMRRLIKIGNHIFYRES